MATIEEEITGNGIASCSAKLGHSNRSCWKLAFAPILIFWFGVSIGSKIVLVALMISSWSSS